MNDALITCEIVDEQDLDTRYLAGTLSEAGAEAFEAHYFGCDRCWALVRRGQEAKAALAAPPGTLTIARPPAVRARPWLAVAASLAVLAAGLQTWRAIAGNRHQPPDDTVRGTADSLSLEVEFRGDTLLARWSRLPGATTYDARFYTNDGAVMFERELAETTLVLPPDVLKVGTAVLMQVQAWDDLRQLRGRSVLQPVSRPRGN
jgi:hypothetical protein